jgi:hypothetical protein
VAFIAIVDTLQARVDAATKSGEAALAALTEKHKAEMVAKETEKQSALGTRTPHARFCVRVGL